MQKNKECIDACQSGEEQEIRIKNNMSTKSSQQFICMQMKFPLLHIFTNYAVRLTPQVSVDVEKGNVDMAFGFVQFLEGEVSQKCSTHEEKCINTDKPGQQAL